MSWSDPRTTLPPLDRDVVAYLRGREGRELGVVRLVRRASGLWWADAYGCRRFDAALLWHPLAPLPEGP